MATDEEDGIHVAHCSVEQLMIQYKLQGVRGGKSKTTTNSHDDQKRADDSVNQ